MASIFGCRTVAEYLRSYLGSPADYVGLENARLVGRELVALAEKTSEGQRFSLMYATCVIRQYREDVLDKFFHEYPDAIYIHDWRNLAEAVQRYTTNRTTKVGWMPSRRAVVDAVQKAQLMERSRGGSTRFYPNSGQLRLYRNGKFIRGAQIVPSSRNDLNVWNVSTVVRLNGDLAFWHEVKHALRA